MANKVKVTWQKVRTAGGHIILACKRCGGFVSVRSPTQDLGPITKFFSAEHSACAHLVDDDDVIVYALAAAIRAFQPEKSVDGIPSQTIYEHSVKASVEKYGQDRVRLWLRSGVDHEHIDELPVTDLERYEDVVGKVAPYGDDVEWVIVVDRRRHIARGRIQREEGRGDA